MGLASPFHRIAFLIAQFPFFWARRKRLFLPFLSIIGQFAEGNCRCAGNCIIFECKLCYKPLSSFLDCFIIFFLKSFNLWYPLLMIALYHQTKTPIDFQCRQRLNPKSIADDSSYSTIKDFIIHFLIWFLSYTQYFGNTKKFNQEISIQRVQM